MMNSLTSSFNTQDVQGTLNMLLLLASDYSLSSNNVYQQIMQLLQIHFDRVQEYLRLQLPKL
jgi:hypothetical protein